MYRSEPNERYTCEKGSPSLSYMGYSSRGKHSSLYRGFYRGGFTVDHFIYFDSEFLNIAMMDCEGIVHFK